MNEPEDPHTVIADCIQNFRPNNPVVGDGTRRDTIYEPPEHSQPLATAIRDALDAAGYKITPKDGDDA